MKSRGRRIAELVAGAFALAVMVHAASAGDEPKPARYYRQKTAAAYRAKDYAGAAANFNKALELIPDHPTLFYNLAAVSALQGKKTESLAFLSRVVRWAWRFTPRRMPTLIRSRMTLGSKPF